MFKKGSSLDLQFKQNDWQVHLEIHQHFLNECDQILFCINKKNIYEALEKTLHLNYEIIKHINFEEEFIAPLLIIYSGELTENAKLEFLESDHKIIKRKCLDLISDICLSEQRSQLLSLAELLDTLIHHDVREANFIYPFLEKKLTSSEKSLILKNFFLKQGNINNLNSLFALKWILNFNLQFLAKKSSFETFHKKFSALDLTFAERIMLIVRSASTQNDERNRLLLLKKITHTLKAWIKKNIDNK
jgi:hypothetical protein